MITTEQSIQAQPVGAGNSDYLRNLGYQDVSIEVNDQCNFHCVYCPYDLDKSHLFAVMDQGKAKELIDQLSEDGALDRYLLFNVLGEPLMYKGLFGLIKYATSQGLKTKLVTNGSLLTQRNIEALVDSSPTILKVSVESLDGAVFEELRGTTIKFETYVRRISGMISSAIDAGQGFRTQLQLDIMYTDPRAYTVNRMCGLANRDEGRKNTYADKGKLLQDIKSFLDQMAEADNLSGQLKSEPKFDLRAFKNNDIPLVSLAPNIAFHIKSYVRWDDIFSKPYPVKSSGRGCHIPNLGIHADGNVVLCCLDYNASTTIGNVFHQSLREILTSPENIKIIEDLRDGRFAFHACKSCQGHTTFLGKLAYGSLRQKTIYRTRTSARAKLDKLRGVTSAATEAFEP